MKICAVGDYDSICGFGALGIETFVQTEEKELSKLITNLANADYAVILITENAAMSADAVIAKYKKEKTPAIIPIPSVMGDYGMGMKGLKDAVERAVGSSEMIFGSDK